MNLKDKTIIIMDHGLNIHVAKKLTESFGKVLYWFPEYDPYPEFHHDTIGDIPNLEKVYWFFKEKREQPIDLFATFDNGFGDIQTDLESQGKRCFGPGEGEEIELEKEMFFKLLDKVGLPNEKPIKIKGVEALKTVLKKIPHAFIKVPFYRGTFETHEHKNWPETDYFLDTIAAKLGANKNVAEFLVQKPIESEIEVGYDGFNILGEYPDNSMLGVEIKDKFYLGCITRNVSPILNHVGDKLMPYFRRRNYHGFYSNEIRIVDRPYSKEFKGTPYYIDPTCRAGSPPSELFIEMYEPHCIARAIWDISEFKVPKLIPQAKWGAQIILKSEWHDEHWLHIKYPKEIEKWLKLKNVCKIAGETWCIPHGNGGYFGSVIAIGNSPKEVWDLAFKRFGMIEALDMEDRNIDLFEKAMKQFKLMKEYGVL